ncbi:MAG: SagB/ThcOx family dehydrogenase [Chloroflexota bacterium]|nr:SagB/ThcOx family dehydrogenase [Chloroflexota bacterium]
MDNKEFIALNYHESTKLGYINLKTKPPLFKSYDVPNNIPLYDQLIEINVPTLRTISHTTPNAGKIFRLEHLASMLHMSSGVIKKNISTLGGELHYRAASSAGALYPIETYVVSASFDGLPDGVYHFNPLDCSLERIALGDYRNVISSGITNANKVSGKPITLIYTSIFWRSTWKYRARGYRYCLWDNGTIIANLTSAANAFGIPYTMSSGFIDKLVGSVIGIDGEKEAVICMVSLGKQTPKEQLVSNPAIYEPKTNDYEGEIEYPEVTSLHRVTTIASEQDLSLWLHPITEYTDSSAGPNIHLEKNVLLDVSKSLSETIMNRGSTRRFSRTPVSKEQFANLLVHCTQPIDSDVLNNIRPSLLDFYFIANSVTGIPNGSYYYSNNRQELELIREGDFRSEAGHLCFEQALGADASAVAFIMADLNKVISEYGPRGYRIAQLEAGIRGGQLYLAAYSMGLGASGITFYDDSVTEFFSPHSRSKTPMFVVTLGETSVTNRVRPFRSRVAARLDALARGANQTT